MKFWGSGVLAAGIFLTYLVPDTLLFIPLVPDRARPRAAQFLLGHGCWSIRPSRCPSCTWIMIGYFQSIPRSSTRRR